MRRVVLLVFASVLVFSLRAAAQDTTVTLAPSAPAGAAATPPAYKVGSDFPLRLSMSYQFTGFRNVDGMTFHNNGINTDFTGYTGHDFALEGTVDAGWGWAPMSPTYKLEQSYVFYGGGFRIGPEKNRFQPWAHALVGGIHMRFTQTSLALGSDNGLAWQVGIGADVKIGARMFWRSYGDYLGTQVFHAHVPQANYQVGTGIGFAF